MGGSTSPATPYRRSSANAGRGSVTRARRSAGCSTGDDSGDAWAACRPRCCASPATARGCVGACVPMPPGHAKSCTTVACQGKSALLRRACLDDDLVKEHGPMMKRVSHVVPLHRKPRSARLPHVVLVSHLRRQGMHSQAEEEYTIVECKGDSKQINSATRGVPRGRRGGGVWSDEEARVARRW